MLRLLLATYFSIHAVAFAASTPLPAHYDLRDTPGALRPVKNEGQCGSTWAFPANTAMEYAIFKQEGLQVTLSEQFILDCDSAGSSCEGGWDATPFVVSNGVVLESDYPYTGTDETCKSVPIFRKATSWGYADPANSEAMANTEAIKTALLQYGPITAGIYASEAFSSYSSGVFNQCDSSQGINHLVSIVGWDDAGGYWIIRNMWGSAWGEQGYARIAYGCNQVGTSAAFVVYTNG